MINFALDWDDTFTADPELFREFAKMATGRGHVVVIVTARFQNNISDIEAEGYEVIATGGAKKRAFCASVDYHPQIWIDDMPEHVGD